MRYLETYTEGKVPGIHHALRPRPAKSFQHLADLCGTHHSLELFIWLQGVLPSNAVEMLRARALKETAIELINTGLHQTDRLQLKHDYVSKDVRIKKVWAQENRE